MAGKVETDEVTGTQTTGHEWDGIKELNTPLPRWWLWTFLASIAFAIGYWVVMPAWPLVSGYTTGIIGYSSRANVVESIDEARAAQKQFVERIGAASLEEIRKDPELLEFALAGGRSAFSVNCSQCHGRGAAGSRGYANLNDDAWLWGGTLDDISQTISYGIRSGHDEARYGDMPAFVRDEILTREEAGDVAEYVLSLSGNAEDEAAVARGAEVFAEQCVACHQEGGVGSPEVGAPNLSDSIWLYAGDKKTILETLEKGRAGVMPAWVDRLAPATIKQLAVYVHSLGGGQ
jgi:cytochrome c oxidase cbb3-type subunit III